MSVTQSYMYIVIAIINICEDFAVEYHVKCNPTKSYLVAYYVSYDVALKLNNCDITHVESPHHPAHCIGDQHNNKKYKYGN